MRRQTELFLTQIVHEIGITPTRTSSLSKLRPCFDSCFQNKLRILFPKLAFNARE